MTVDQEEVEALHRLLNEAIARVDKAREDGDERAEQGAMMSALIYGYYLGYPMDADECG